MNERIKELIEHVSKEVFPINSITFMETFAELIVKECAGIYDKIDNGNLHMGTDDYLEALYKTFLSKK